MNFSTSLETAISQLPTTSPSKTDSDVMNGRWTKEEHQRFVEAIKAHGKNWKKVEEYVGTRTGAQIRSHAQKFFLKMEKEIKTSQKSKGNKDSGKSNKKIAQDLASAFGNLSALVKSEDSLKANLSFNEITESLTEASDQSTVLPASPDTHLVAAEKSSEYVSKVAAKPNDMQSESSTQSDNSKLSKNQLLTKLKACEERVEEYHQLVKNFTAAHTTDTTLTSNHFNTNKPYHHFVYLGIMNYFNGFNKDAKSLKISDLVDLSYKTNFNTEESFCDAPAGKKKVKIL